MTKEELLKALAIIVKNNSTKPDEAAQLIFDLYADHGSYTVVAGKIVHRETGVELGK